MPRAPQAVSLAIDALEAKGWQAEIVDDDEGTCCERGLAQRCCAHARRAADARPTNADDEGYDDEEEA